MTALWFRLSWWWHRRHLPLFPPQEWESLPFEPNWSRYDTEDRLS